jgi:hypothetical protein
LPSMTSTPMSVKHPHWCDRTNCLTDEGGRYHSAITETELVRITTLAHVDERDQPDESTFQVHVYDEPPLTAKQLLEVTTSILTVLHTTTPDW